MICSELRTSFVGLKEVLSGTKSPKQPPVKRDYKPVSLLSTCCQISIYTVTNSLPIKSFYHNIVSPIPLFAKHTVAG